MSTAGDNLSAESRDRLLRLTRRSIESHFDGVDLPRPSQTDQALEAPAGAFVTLKQGGTLRGCIGRLEAEWPLWETVARMARAAAFEDPRFPALERDELADTSIEISVMTPARRVASPDEIVPGEHGVIIEHGLNHAVFLPQVASEQGWSRDTLLSQLSLKAGLPADAWRSSDAVLSVFRAVVIVE